MKTFIILLCSYAFSASAIEMYSTQLVDVEGRRTVARTKDQNSRLIYQHRTLGKHNMKITETSMTCGSLYNDIVFQNLLDTSMCPP